jgi:hypothetical protein
MAKLKLTARTVETTAPGKYADAGCRGLYVVVSETGTAKWVFRFTWRAKQREMAIIRRAGAET